MLACSLGRVLLIDESTHVPDDVIYESWRFDLLQGLLCSVSSGVDILNFVGR